MKTIVCSMLVALCVLSGASGVQAAARKKAVTVKPVAGAPVDADTLVRDFLPMPEKYGTVTSCPVMKEKVVVSINTPAVSYKGKVYYLCCPSCLGKFKANPAAYAR